MDVVQQVIDWSIYFGGDFVAIYLMGRKLDEVQVKIENLEFKNKYVP